MKLILSLLAFNICCTIFSQDYNQIKSDYPNENVVVLSLKHHIHISQSGSKLSIKESTTKKQIYLTTNRLSHATQSVSYDSFKPISEISGYTLNKDGKKERKYSIKSFEDKDVLINGIFFNDRKLKRFSFPNVTEGSVTVLDYEKQIKDPHFLPSYILGFSVPVASAEISVSFPSSVKVAYKTFNIDSTKTLFSSHSKDGRTTYSWHIKDISKLTGNADFSPTYYVPQVLIYIKSFNRKGTEYPILSDASDLYKWYTTLIAKTNKTDQTELKQLTQDLIKGATSDLEKIKRIYYFVQNEINYIAFEDGLNGFIPRDATVCFGNKYGDCKDMANLLNEMLKFAGIESYITWIGTRNRPYSYYEVPTPITDNHMITAVRVNDEFLFLDATAKYLGFGYPSPFTQGKEALVGLSDSEHKILKVPEVDPENNRLTILSDLSIKDGQLIGNHRVELTGYEKLEMLHKISRKEDDDKGFLERALDFGFKNSEFRDINYSETALKYDTLFVGFSSTTPNILREIDNSYYLKLHMDTGLSHELVAGERKDHAKKINHKFKKQYITEINLPSDYRIVNLPENVTFSNEDYNFSINYSRSDKSNAVLIDKIITVNTLKVNTPDIDNWNRFIKKLNRATKQSIVLTKQKS